MRQQRLFLFKQRDAMDCGVAAFAMIAAHYGRNLDLEDIRDSCSLNKEGVSLLSISKTAEKFGFKTVGGIITIDDLTHKKCSHVFFIGIKSILLFSLKLQEKGKRKGI